MSRDEAHRTLDLARAGGEVTELEITEALAATGDLSTWRAAQQPAEMLASEVKP